MEKFNAHINKFTFDKVICNLQKEVKLFISTAFQCFKLHDCSSVLMVRSRAHKWASSGMRLYLSKIKDITKHQVLIKLEFFFLPHKRLR